MTNYALNFGKIDILSLESPLSATPHFYCGGGNAPRNGIFLRWRVVYYVGGFWLVILLLGAERGAPCSVEGCGDLLERAHIYGPYGAIILLVFL